METIKLPLYNAPGKYALVDGDYDGEWLSTFKWRLLPNGHVVSTIYDWRSKNNRQLYLSRMAYGESLIPPGYSVVCRDGNHLNCHRDNLVAMTASEVALNRPQGSLRGRKPGGAVGVSGYRGVRVIQMAIYAHIRGGFLKRPDGSFKRFFTAEDAARVYDQEAIRLWGNKATLNFPESTDITATFNPPLVPHATRLTREEPRMTETHYSPTDSAGNEYGKLTPAPKRNINRELTGLLEGFTATVANWFGGDLSTLEDADWAELKRIQGEIEKLMEAQL